MATTGVKRQVGGGVFSSPALARAVKNAPNPKSPKLPTITLPFLTGQSRQGAIRSDRFDRSIPLSHGIPVASTAGVVGAPPGNVMPVKRTQPGFKSDPSSPAIGSSATGTTSPVARTQPGASVTTRTGNSRVAGAITQVGGFLTQENPGGSAPAVAGAATSTGDGYFRNIGSGDLAGRFGLTWVTIAEIAAILVAGYYLWQRSHKGRR